MSSSGGFPSHSCTSFSFTVPGKTGQSTVVSLSLEVHCSRLRGLQTQKSLILERHFFITKQRHKLLVSSLGWDFHGLAASLLSKTLQVFKKLVKLPPQHRTQSAQ